MMYTAATIAICTQATQAASKWQAGWTHVVLTLMWQGNSTACFLVLCHIHELGKTKGTNVLVVGDLPSSVDFP